MIPQAHITAWRAVAPWPDDAQVEQDLVLSRATVELFADPRLGGMLALRGGTALNKLFVVPGVRYSEDIDLVQTKAAPAGPLIDAVRARLDPWLGTPKRERASSGVTLIYRFDSEIAPVRALRLKIEINTREHFTVRGLQSMPMSIDNPWFHARAAVQTYTIDELMGTKLRALYQRRKGRDLFDLWYCLDRGLIDPSVVTACFLSYMEAEHHVVSRAQFERNLELKRSDPDFLRDIAPLLSPTIQYDPIRAADRVATELIARLPGEPWAGDRGREE